MQKLHSSIRDFAEFWRAGQMPLGHQVYLALKLNCHHSISTPRMNVISLLKILPPKLVELFGTFWKGSSTTSTSWISTLVDHQLSFWRYSPCFSGNHGFSISTTRRCVGSFHGSGILYSEASFGWSEVHWTQFDFTFWRFLSDRGDVNSLDYHQVGWRNRFCWCFFFGKWCFFHRLNVGISPCQRWTFVLKLQRWWVKMASCVCSSFWRFQQFRRMICWLLLGSIGPGFMMLHVWWIWWVSWSMKDSYPRWLEKKRRFSYIQLKSRKTQRSLLKFSFCGKLICETSNSENFVMFFFSRRFLCFFLQVRLCGVLSSIWNYLCTVPRLSNLERWPLKLMVSQDVSWLMVVDLQAAKVTESQKIASPWI